MDCVEVGNGEKAYVGAFIRQRNGRPDGKPHADRKVISIDFIKKEVETEPADLYSNDLRRRNSVIQFKSLRQYVLATRSLVPPAPKYTPGYYWAVDKLCPGEPIPIVIREFPRGTFTVSVFGYELDYTPDRFEILERIPQYGGNLPS